MQIGGPDDKFLIAGGSLDGGVAMFERTGDGGNLTLLATNTDLPTRTTFVFFDNGSASAGADAGEIDAVESTTSKRGLPEESTSGLSKPENNSALGENVRAWAKAVSVQVLLVSAVFVFA